MEPEKIYSHYLLKLGGTELTCSFTFSDTAGYFCGYCSGPYEGKGDVSISEWFWKKINTNIGPKSPYIEYTSFSSAASTWLLYSDHFLIHAVAFRWHDQAWIITGPSGVGKSTRIRMLQEKFNDEFTVISGDRPVLQKNTDDSFFVHPSPWNGKEGWQGAVGAPLAGIICLQRGNPEKIERLTARAAAPIVFISILQTGEFEEDVRKAAAHEEALLNNIPIWQLTSDDPESSVRLIYETLLTGERK